MSSLRPRLTFANVISVIALFFALGGGAYAAVKLKSNQVKSKHIAPDAVQGVDANESSFDTVPKATTANSAGTAANADNANTLDGIDSNDFVVGEGAEFGGAEIPDNGQESLLQLTGGDIDVDCSATPTLSWDDLDDTGDNDVTDIWTNGVHTTVTDGTANVSLDPNMANDSARLEIWDGQDFVASARVSVFWDGAETECSVAYFVNIEPNGF